MSDLVHIGNDVIISGMLYDDEPEFLCSIASSMGGNIIEIGAFEGASTICFSRGVKCHGTVFSIEPHDRLQFVDYPFGMGLFAKILKRRNRRRYLDNIKKYSVCNNVTPIHDLSYKVHDQFLDESASILFIDGSHEYPGVKTDLMLYIPKLKSGGMLIVHDCDGVWPDVVKAVNEEVTVDRFYNIMTRSFGTNMVTAIKR